jgi:hypothetical protein
VAPGLTVDGLLRMASDAVADAVGVPKSGGAPAAAAAGHLLRCDGRLLRDGGATLAEAGVTSGSRIEVVWAVQGGMPKNGCLPPFMCFQWGRPAAAGQEGASPPPSPPLTPSSLPAAAATPAAATPAAATPARRRYLSFTRSNLMAMLSILATMLREGGFTGAITSHALQGLFQNAKTKGADGKATQAYPKEVVAGPFHPQDKWPEFFSTLRPTIIVTYTWAMDLIKDLPAFLDWAERMLQLTDEEKEHATWWLDIFFNDQNAKEMEGELAMAKRFYKEARFHVVLLLNGVFKRGWCIAELLYRIQVPPCLAMAARGVSSASAQPHAVGGSRRDS